MSEILLLIFELIGTVAFAVSGAMTGLRKKMDIFGVITLGLITAVGGGIIRDLVLGNTPPETFKNPIYAILAIITSIIVFIPLSKKTHTSKNKIFDLFLFIMDSLGLAVFTVVGIRTAVGISSDFNVFLLLFVGVITGTGGGVLRDVLAGDTPYIFVKHFYATASLIGALTSILLWNVVGVLYSMIFGSAIIVILRFLAAFFHWNLPKSEFSQE